jgi:hypothetical protein
MPDMDPQIVEQTFTEELYRLPADRTVIVLSKPWAEHSPEELERLQKISDALGKYINRSLSLSTFRVICQPQLDISQLEPLPRELIYFGPIPKGFNYYEVTEVRGMRMVLSESLTVLIGDEALRKKLWTALQQLFAN